MRAINRARLFHPLQSASLQRKMTSMLLVILLLSILFTGAVVLLGNMYLQRFNTIMNDCYDINQLLTAYAREADAFDAYVLYGGDAAYSEYLASRNASNRAQDAMAIDPAESMEQHLLLQAVVTSYDSFRAACDETVYKRIAGSEYAIPYDRALRTGQYIEGYIKTLLQTAIAQGQEVYQRNLMQFRMVPMLFAGSIVMAFLCIVLWMRWTVRHVVTPINDLIRVAGDMRANQYDTPDIPVTAGDEIAQLSHVVNEMKHSTAQLVDSLRAQQEMESRLHAEEVRRMRIETTMDTLRLSLLQSQINPHFLFNTLNIISRMAQMEGAPVTEELIVRLANLFRYNLQSVDDVVPLEKELKIVSDYIAIQQIRFGERISFDLVCDIDPAHLAVPVFTMQPLIENAVIHGISPMEEGGLISVAIHQEGQALTICVSDTGVGIAPDQLELLLSRDVVARQHVSGLGLGNVRARIRAHYPGSRFDVESRVGEGTKILITIPLEEAEHV